MSTYHCNVCHQDVEICEKCGVAKSHLCVSTTPLLPNPFFLHPLGGYTCLNCKLWVQYGTLHTCVSVTYPHSLNT
jgi:hypothetical protein